MFALSFLVGVSLALQLSNLPEAQWLWLFVPLFVCLYKFPKLKIFLALPIGFLWVVSHGLWTLSSSLPDELIKKDLLVIGKVVSLPDKNQTRTRFVLDVESYEYQNKKIKGPKRIRLNWYGQETEIHSGQLWKLLVRLKPAHGMQNPGGFDYEKWLFERGIRATGYVRNSENNRLLERHNKFQINPLREQLKARIQSFLPDSQFRSLVLALSIGDKTEITESQWNVLTATGTNHLVAISGLHIGLVAGGVYFVFLYFLKRSRFILLRFPAHKAAAICALIAAFFYAMLAGFAIPTQRALVMIAVVMLGVLINRRFSFSKILSFALIAVLILDPFSALSTGFWLSFAAVAAILYAMQGRLKPGGLWWQWGRLQLIVSLALIPILLFTFQSFSIISPIANVLAVPWISFVTVPLVFLGILFSFFDPIAKGMMFLANESLTWLWQILEYLSAMEYSQWKQFTPQTWTLLPALLGILLIIAPKGFPARYLSIFFLLPLFLVKPDKLENNEFDFYLLDVGQGLSAVVQTRNHVLVFDTGPKFRSGFNSGEAVILPFLKKLAVEEIDVLVISHGDNDHIGGMDSILENITVNKILSGALSDTPQNIAQSCLAGTNWQWDGVDFEVLHPKGDDFIDKRNNGSCVLRVSIANQSVLLTGDIEKSAEEHLVQTSSEKIRANILVAPHHGSNTSSTEAFIQTVHPDWVLFPAGYVNRFKFPTKKVLKRYIDNDVEYMVTGEQGAIKVLFNQQIPLKPEGYRLNNRKFWH